MIDTGSLVVFAIVVVIVVVYMLIVRSFVRSGEQADAELNARELQEAERAQASAK